MLLWPGRATPFGSGLLRIRHRPGGLMPAGLGGWVVWPGRVGAVGLMRVVGSLSRDGRVRLIARRV